VVTVSGDEDRSWEAPDDGEAFATDYWQSDEELRAQYEFLSIQGDPTFEEIQTEGLAVFSFFSMTCVGSDGDTVAIFVSGATTETTCRWRPGPTRSAAACSAPGICPPGR
jgi:hypothetical protein